MRTASPSTTVDAPSTTVEAPQTETTVTIGNISDPTIEPTFEMSGLRLPPEVQERHEATKKPVTVLDEVPEMLSSLSPRSAAIDLDQPEPFRQSFEFPANGLKPEKILHDKLPDDVLPSEQLQVDWGDAVNVSEDVATTADQIVVKEDSNGKPFVIGDKVNGKLYAFNEHGKLLARMPALYGKEKGDIRTTGARITPSGRFEADLDQSMNNPDERGFIYGTTIDFYEDDDSIVAIHRLYTAIPEEDRPGRLESATPEDNRISYGCVNCPDKAYEEILKPLFKKGGVVYILPETDEGMERFKIGR